MMRAFGQYILKKPINGLWIIVASTLIPLMGWLASVVLGLVTLCKTPKESAVALLVLILVNVAYSYVVYRDGDVLAAILSLFSSAFAGGLFVWAMGLLLRRKAGWTVILIATLVVGLPLLFLLRWFADEIGLLIIVWLEKSLMQVSEFTQAISPFGTGVDVAKIGIRFYQQFFTPELANYFTGSMIVVVLYVAGIGQLLVARWWQSRVFPQSVSLAKELLSIRLPVALMFIFLLCAALFFWFRSASLFGIVPIVLTVWLIASLSLIHGFFYRRKAGWVFIILIYLGLTALSKAMLPGLLLIACVDSVVDFRHRFSRV
ncbi:MAG: hypothetical protein K0R12_158 [Gammaproteobacteria bacterium]|jgi:hypothetical protein|nr:hypothetical protein [Gammaproteobacteria bacterium]